MKIQAILLFAALVALAGGAYWFTSQGRQAPSGGAEPPMLTETHGSADSATFPEGIGASQTATGSPQAPVSSERPGVIKEALLTLDVEGMTCQACSAAVEHQLKKLDGVLSAEASHRTGKVTVKYNSEQIKNLKTFTADCSAAIERAGFKMKG